MFTVDPGTQSVSEYYNQTSCTPYSMIGALFVDHSSGNRDEDGEKPD